ncbi:MULTISPECIES: DNA-binding protein [unclassified Streptomyces]|uniref:DNA-binding protein n=2 Tax=Streptomyces TaxID=1883 RepID=UPI0033C66590
MDSRAAMTMEELLSLPPAVSVATAARALGIGADKAYELIKGGEFPARTIPLGRTQKVATASLWEALGVRR